MVKPNEAELKQRLSELQKQFNTGDELKLIYLPGAVRINDRGNALSGELQSNCILIYEPDLDRAIATLNHEFVEYRLHPIMSSMVHFWNMQNREIFE